MISFVKVGGIGMSHIPSIAHSMMIKMRTINLVVHFVHFIPKTVVVGVLNTRIDSPASQG